jgi:hypothetical protein
LFSINPVCCNGTAQDGVWQTKQSGCQSFPIAWQYLPLICFLHASQTGWLDLPDSEFDLIFLDSDNLICETSSARFRDAWLLFWFAWFCEAAGEGTGGVLACEGTGVLACDDIGGEFVGAVACRGGEFVVGRGVEFVVGRGGELVVGTEGVEWVNFGGGGWGENVEGVELYKVEVVDVTFELIGLVTGEVNFGVVLW